MLRAKQAAGKQLQCSCSGKAGGRRKSGNNGGSGRWDQQVLAESWSGVKRMTRHVPDYQSQESAMHTPGETSETLGKIGPE
jgi:hypothetical protein